jgi:hypothetical protein
LIGVILAIATGERPKAVELTWEYTVQLTASVQSSPPQILLSWPQDVVGTPQSYVIYRKDKPATAWGSPVTLSGSTTQYLDNAVAVGTAYEYQVHKIAGTYQGYGYICAGINAPLVENRGKVILLIDNSVAAALQPELARLTQDLVGDGWIVLRHDVSRSDAVESIKAIIRNDYNSDPANVIAVFLFGHIPVPYSGDLAPDGHVEDTGAWPADLFYAEMTSTWTDSTVNDTSAGESRRWNVPGDGKYDASLVPSNVELQIGRVDLAKMPGRKTYGGPPTFPAEVELLRNYLSKDHRFRHKLYTAEPRGLVHNVTGDREGAAPAASAWRNFAPFFGPANIRLCNNGEFLPLLRTNSYLWAYATDGADYSSMANLGGTSAFNGASTTDLVEKDIRTVFTMLMGSRFGFWDSEDNFMRAVLATPSYGLSCVYAGSPHWYFHHLALGETLGYSARLTQNNLANGLYRNQVNQGAGQVHVALMGDPTLRMHPVSPPSNLSGNVDGTGAHLQWIGSPDTILGYHIYRAATAAGPFARLTGSFQAGTSFTDPSLSGGTYMVRAIKLQTSSSGNYYNPSQGVFLTLAGSIDSDGDGMSDADEIIAGTDPQNRASVFKVIFTSVSSSNLATIVWTSVSGKAYRLGFKSRLTDSGLSYLSPLIIADGSGTTSWSTSLPSGSGFLRVVLIPTPTGDPPL